MIETLDRSSTRERLRDGLGRRLSAQRLRGNAAGIGCIDDGLSDDTNRARHVATAFGMPRR